MVKKISLDERSWIALITVLSDYVFIANTIIEQKEEHKIEASDEFIDDLEVNIGTAAQIMEQLMGEPENKTLN